MNGTKTILILCEESGVFASLYRKAGYNVVVKDLRFGADNDVRLLPCYQADVHGILAFPPCTHLAGSGARWWEAKGESALLEALAVADACMRAVVLYGPRWWALENPVGRLTQHYGKPAFSFNPNEFAGYADDPGEEAYTKKTCLWGRFIKPKPKPVEPVLGSKMHLLPPSPERAALRSKTPLGFARAFQIANP